MKLWQKDINIKKTVEKFTVGNDYILDKKLLRYDCIASKAHAEMLLKIGILSESECSDLLSGLDEIIALDEQGAFEIKVSDEDCHTAIENFLTAKYGETGKKIHTGRSRNDQVLTALRLLYRDSIDEIVVLTADLQDAFATLADKYGEIEIPGFTHTRKAMPSSVNMWSGAFIDAMSDNQLLLKNTRRLINQSPLGTAAGYGSPIELDREFVARKLGFEKVQQNPIYTQMSRGKFESLILNNLAQIMFDLNRCAADLIFFSMPEWGIFKLPAEFCTGSSIMPQKLNPDVLELVRANYHVISGLESQIKTMSANLITGYHRDLQLSKEPILTGFEITFDCLSIMNELIAATEVNKESAERHMTDELYATEKAYKLVKQGMSFREAYKTVAAEIFKK